MRQSGVLLIVLFALVACAPVSGPDRIESATPAGSDAGAPRSTAGTALSPAATEAYLTIEDTRTCAVTDPIVAPAEFAPRLFGSSAAFGNGSLWVGGLGEAGVILAEPRFVEGDGSIGWKLGWWRIDPGRLTISGRRLDAAAPPLRAEVSDGYGDQGFVPSGVRFPSEGCWEVTGTLGDSTLTFTMFVLRT